MCRGTSVVVNADESEPGAFKDRQVMATVPHRLIEGALIAAHAIESKDVFIYIRGEYLAEYETLQEAVDEADAAGLFDERARRRPSRRGAPTSAARRPRCSTRSRADAASRARARRSRPCRALYNAPTQVNNVCTIATLPIVIAMGAEKFAKIGAESAPGTAIFSISGNVERPGNYELELGTPHAGADLRARCGIAGRPEAEGSHPRRLVGAGADARPDRRPARLRLARRAEDVLRRRPR
jgi:NADH-quinone oxidoreductase subunit F